MTRATFVVAGDVVLNAGHDGLERVEAIGIGVGRVVAAGSKRDVVDAAAGASCGWMRSPMPRACAAGWNPRPPDSRRGRGCVGEAGTPRR